MLLWNTDICDGILRVVPIFGHFKLNDKLLIFHLHPFVIATVDHLPLHT